MYSALFVIRGLLGVILFIYATKLLYVLIKRPINPIYWSSKRFWALIVFTYQTGIWLLVIVNESYLDYFLMYFGIQCYLVVTLPCTDPETNMFDRNLALFLLGTFAILAQIFFVNSLYLR